MVGCVLVVRKVEVGYYGNVVVNWSGVEKGKRIVYRLKSVDDVREKVKYFIDKGWLIEFMGCGWRCVKEDGRYWWSKIKDDLEDYGDDLYWWWGL